MMFESEEQQKEFSEKREERIKQVKKQLEAKGVKTDGMIFGETLAKMPNS